MPRSGPHASGDLPPDRVRQEAERRYDEERPSGSSRGIPRLAREFGVNPDEPKLQQLGTAKATSLIGAVLDRVNAQAPPDER